MIRSVELEDVDDATAWHRYEWDPVDPIGGGRADPDSGRRREYVKLVYRGLDTQN